MGKCRLCRQEGHNRKSCPTLKTKIASLELDLETGEITPCELLGTIQYVEEEAPPKSTVRDVPTILEEFDLSMLIKRYKKTCAECSRELYCSRGELCSDCYYKKREKCEKCETDIKYIYKWKEASLCGKCYITEKERLSDMVQDYLTECGMTSCVFCGKGRVGVYGFHLDHKNMFDKSDSVIKMILRGADFDLIKEEIDKCQLLCVDCHMLVTGAEVSCGFTGAKCRKLNEKELYDKVMTVIYEKIRAFVRSGSVD